ncbi:hypothetical protein V6V47_18295 [Micromonospora sp. CPCC 205539]|uniref:hypothetical protein n=1 Tax=Micromonospora sp. CPCC 205539 TaxID=3122408 RepID=UPI002FEF8D82
MHRRCATLLALPLLALLAACATPAASADPQQPSTSATPLPQQSYWPGQEALMDAATQVENAALPRWPHTYAGVSLDVPGDVLLVYRVPTRDFDAEIRALVPAVTVRFVDTPYSARTLDRWIERVRADVAHWQSRGVVVHSSFVELGECVTLEVAEPQRDAAKLAAFYPGIPLCVRKGWPAVPLNAG